MARGYQARSCGNMPIRRARLFMQVFNVYEEGNIEEGEDDNIEDGMLETTSILKNGVPPLFMIHGRLLRVRKKFAFCVGLDSPTFLPTDEECARSVTLFEVLANDKAKFPNILRVHQNTIQR